MWGAQGSYAGEQPGVTEASGSKTGKANSMSANEAGAGGRHGVRPGGRKRVAGQQENPVGKSSGVRDREGGCEAYGVVDESSGVGGEDRGREAYGVTENPGGDHQRV